MHVQIDILLAIIAFLLILCVLILIFAHNWRKRRKKYVESTTDSIEKGLSTLELQLQESRQALTEKDRTLR